MGVKRRIDVEIGELAVDGLDPAGADLVAISLRRELVRLIQEHGLPARSSPLLPAGMLGARDPAVMGAAAAQAAFRRLGR